jgi:hypothetical protein
MTRPSHRELVLQSCRCGTSKPFVSRVGQRARNSKSGGSGGRQATSDTGVSCGGSGVISTGRSRSLPLWNNAPARTNATNYNQRHQLRSVDRPPPRLSSFDQLPARGGRSRGCSRPTDARSRPARGRAGRRPLPRSVRRTGPCHCEASRCKSSSEPTTTHRGCIVAGSTGLRHLIREPIRHAASRYDQPLTTTPVNRQPSTAPPAVDNS